MIGVATAEVGGADRKGERAGGCHDRAGRSVYTREFALGINRGLEVVQGAVDHSIYRTRNIGSEGSYRLLIRAEIAVVLQISEQAPKPKIMLALDLRDILIDLEVVLGSAERHGVTGTKGRVSRINDLRAADTFGGAQRGVQGWSDRGCAQTLKNETRQKNSWVSSGSGSLPSE